MKQMHIEITENRYRIDLDRLMVLAHRLNNSKRNFLFVSKTLGKHIEVEPNMCRVMGYILASLKYGRSASLSHWLDYLQNPSGYRLTIGQTLQTPYQPMERVAVLGFAETATGLGMGVASAIEGAYYLQTTRESILDIPNLIQFEEEHSHATQHQCFPSEPSELEQVDRLILVDDELTTGQSLLNLIEELIKITPIRRFTMLTILDWRTPEHEARVQAMCDTYGLEIEIEAVIKGVARSEDQTVYQGQTPTWLTSTIAPEHYLVLNQIPRQSRQTKEGIRSYYRENGRFGLTQETLVGMERYFHEAAEVIVEKLKTLEWTGKFYGHLLVVGHGEDIYYPSRVAAAIATRFDGLVDFKTTTRSPIYCQSEEGYPIQQAHAFKDESGVTYYVYNKDRMDETYDAVIFITETGLSVQFAEKQLTVQL